MAGERLPWAGAGAAAHPPRWQRPGGRGGRWAALPPPRRRWGAGRHRPGSGGPAGQPSSLAGTLRRKSQPAFPRSLHPKKRKFSRGSGRSGMLSRLLESPARGSPPAFPRLLSRGTNRQLRCPSPVLSALCAMREPAGCAPGRLPVPTRGARRGLPCERGEGRSPHVPPRRRAGGRRGAPLCPPGTPAPDCALSPAAGGQSPGRKSAPRPGQAPGPPPQRGPSRHPPRRRPPPPPSAPPAPPFSAQDTHQVSCCSGTREGGGCGRSWRGPISSPIPLASSAPDVPGSLNPRRIRAVRAFSSALGEPRLGTRGWGPLAKGVTD